MEPRVTKFAPSVLVTDEYGNQHTITPPGWAWVLAFALRGVPWAVEEIESGRCDAAQQYLAALKQSGGGI